MTAETMVSAPRLKLIQKIGVGVNTIDLEEAVRRGIAVYNMPGTNTAAVAEMTIALMLTALRKLTEFDRMARRSAGWQLDAGSEAALGEIAGRTVGLVGSVARRVAGVLAAMDAGVVYWSRTRQPDFPGRFLARDELLACSDIVSLHIPLTRETSHILDGHDIEPPDDDHPPLHADNVIVTPHVAWLTQQTWRRSLEVARENVLRLNQGALLQRVA